LFKSDEKCSAPRLVQLYAIRYKRLEISIYNLNQVNQCRKDNSKSYGSHGKMSTLGLESVLVSDVIDGVGDTIDNKAVGSANAEDGFLGTAAQDLSRFLVLLSVAQFIAVFVAVETDVVRGSLLNEDNLISRACGLSTLRCS
ncbi:hypothetical protein TSAR_012566, partial [Trichomalopsis sarcophagae]